MAEPSKPLKIYTNSRLKLQAHPERSAIWNFSNEITSFLFVLSLLVEENMSGWSSSALRAWKEFEEARVPNLARGLAGVAMLL